MGQGIIRNIRKSYPDIHITGVNVTGFSAGNHLCDAFYPVTFAYNDSYIEELQYICNKEKIELIIPSTDYEVYYLSANRQSFTAVIAVSGKFSAETYLDKYLTFRHHRQNNIPFAASFLPSEYKGQFGASIAKPRKGRGSRGLVINPTSWNNFSDDEYMIQELHTGKEITTAFYVDKYGKLHGFITLLRYLENGATTQCKVVFEYDEVVKPVLDAMIKHGDISGSANLQSIITENGSIQPFEINCRISGTNSIRSNFGFEDVKYTIQEYLLNQNPSTPSISAGVAVRILMDVIYPNQSDFNSCKDNSIGFHLF